MAELGQEMDVDSNLVVPSQRSKSPRPWEISKLREAITATFTQMLEPIRQVVREEVSSAIKCEQREQEPPSPNPAIQTVELQNQFQLLQAENNSLLDQINQLNEELARAKFAVYERDARNKKLQQVIIENSQNVTPPMDDEIVILFNQLNHDVMKIVKKHFTKPFRPAESDKAIWKDFKPLSPENRELLVRGFIADYLHGDFFPRKHKIFGLDAKREGVMRDFELMLEESDKVSEADIVDWRIRTVSCAKKLGLTRNSHRSRDLASDLVRELRPVGPQKGSELRDAEETMAAICNTALNIAILFRSNTVSYSWLQRKSLSSILMPESEIIGSITPNRPAELCKPWKMVFGGAVKNQESEEDRVVLTKSELLVF